MISSMLPTLCKSATNHFYLLIYIIILSGRCGFLISDPRKPLWMILLQIGYIEIKRELSQNHLNLTHFTKKFHPVQYSGYPECHWLIRNVCWILFIIHTETTDILWHWKVSVSTAYIVVIGPMNYFSIQLKLPE